MVRLLRIDACSVPRFTAYFMHGWAFEVLFDWHNLTVGVNWTWGTGWRAGYLHIGPLKTGVTYFRRANAAPVA